MSAPLLPVLLVATLASAGPAAPGQKPSVYVELSQRFFDNASCVRAERRLHDALGALLAANAATLKTSCTKE